MKCPECDSKNVEELSNLHCLWACGNCGFQGDGSLFDPNFPGDFEPNVDPSDIMLAQFEKAHMVWYDEYDRPYLAK